MHDLFSKKFRLVSVELSFLFLFLFPVLAFGSGSAKIFKKFPNKYFIESGSYLGDGVQQALNSQCFQTIHSIELSPNYYHQVCKRFKSYQNVVIWQGDSSAVLKAVLASIDAPATFWLDAHYSGGNTAKGSTFSPILRELDCIKEHFIKTHVILIDDVRLFGTWEFDYVTKEQIVQKVLEINPNYTIEYWDCPYKAKDVLIAYVKKALN